jgi:hypothetical protein
VEECPQTIPVYMDMFIKEERSNKIDCLELEKTGESELVILFRDGKVLTNFSCVCLKDNMKTVSDFLLFFWVEENSLLSKYLQ